MDNIGNIWNITASNINIAGVPLWDLYSNSDKGAVCLIRLYTMDANENWKFDEIKREFDEEKDELGESVFFISFEYDIKSFRINDTNPVYLSYCFIINNEVCAIGGSSNYPYYYMFIDTSITPNRNLVETVLKNSEIYSEEIDSLYEQWYKKAGLNHALNNLRNDHDVIPIGEDRVIQMSDNQNIIIQFDNESELITFRAKREYDGIDLSEKTLYLYGITPSGKNYKDLVFVNIDEEDDNYIIISWKVTNIFADGHGIMEFAIVAEGENITDKYLWQTHPAKMTIYPSILNDDENEFQAISLNKWQDTLEDRIGSLETAYNNGEIKWQSINKLLLTIGG